MADAAVTKDTYDLVKDLWVPAVPVAIGAFIAIVGAFGTTFFKDYWATRQERKALGVMLAAEIEVIVEGVKRRQLVEYYTYWALHFELPTMPTDRPSVTYMDRELPDYLKANMHRIGLLGPELARDTTRL